VLAELIALRRREGGEAQAFALTDVGANPSAIARLDFADWLRKETGRSPFSTRILASELRARYFQF